MLGIVIAVVEMDNTLTVCLHHIPGKQNTLTQIAADLTGHIVALGGVDHRVFVGVLLLGLFVVALDEGENLIVRRVALAHERAGIAIGDVALGNFKRAVRHDLMLDKVLDLFNRGGAPETLAGKLHTLGDALDLNGRHAGIFIYHIVGLGDRRDDLDDVEFHFRAVALDNSHGSSLLFFDRPVMGYNTISCGGLFMYNLIIAHRAL